MKHIVLALLSALAFISGIYSLYKPLGRELIPQIAPFFVGDKGIWGTIKKASEPEEGMYEFANLKNDVKIARDEFGIPHIYASTYNDALFALGYITARDRLFQIEMQSRLISGETSEWFGKNNVELDKFMLNTGLEKLSSNLISATYSSNEYSLLKEYSTGINAYINAEAEQIRPFEYALLGLNIRYSRPVDGIRSLLWFHFLMNFNLDDFYAQELVNKLGNQAFNELFYSQLDYISTTGGDKAPKITKPLIPELSNSSYKNTFDLLVKQLELLERITGWKPNSFNSNTIAYKSSPKQQALAYSMIGPLTKPNLFYEVYIHLNGQEIHGFTIPGIPGIIFGNNDSVSWTINPAPLNVIDFSEVSDSVQVGNEEGYSIDVRESSGYTHSIKYSANGVLLSSGTEIIEMSWPGIRTCDVATGLMKAAFSGNLEDLQQALIGSGLPVAQIVGFDSDGLGYFLSASVPIRNQYLGVVSGRNYEKQNLKYLTTDLIRVEEKNSLIYTNQFPLNKEESNLPYFTKQGFWRDARLRSLVQKLEKPVDEKMLVKLLNDRFMVENKLQPLFTEMFKGKINSPLNALGNELRVWDYIADKDASYPKFFSNFEKILPNLTYDEFPFRFYPDHDITLINLIKNPKSKWFDQQKTENIETGLDILSKAFNEAYDLTVLESGAPENWTWAVTNRGKVKHISNNDLLNQLNENFVIREGTTNTINQNSDGIFSYAPIVKYSSELKNKKMHSRALVFSGNSANRYSVFYDNQMSTWVGTDLRPQLAFSSYDSLYKNGYLILKSER